jgi:hypothetical protein
MGQPLPRLSAPTTRLALRSKGSFRLPDAREEITSRRKCRSFWQASRASCLRAAWYPRPRLAPEYSPSVRWSAGREGGVDRDER